MQFSNSPISYRLLNSYKITKKSTKFILFRKKLLKIIKLAYFYEKRTASSGMESEKNDFIPLPDDACYASLHSDGIDLASEVVAES